MANQLTNFPNGIETSVLVQSDEMGSQLEFRSISELVTIAAAPTTSTTMSLPLNTVILAVSSRVNVASSGVGLFNIGVTGTPSQYGVLVNAVPNATSGLIAPTLNASVGTTILITPNATPAAADGRVTITIHYYVVVP